MSTFRYHATDTDPGQDVTYAVLVGEDEENETGLGVVSRSGRVWAARVSTRKNYEKDEFTTRVAAATKLQEVHDAKAAAREARKAERLAAESAAVVEAPLSAAPLTATEAEGETGVSLSDLVAEGTISEETRLTLEAVKPAEGVDEPEEIEVEVPDEPVDTDVPLEVPEAGAEAVTTTHTTTTGTFTSSVHTAPGVELTNSAYTPLTTTSNTYVPEPAAEPKKTAWQRFKLWLRS